jgi:hypothetical protein
VSGSTDRLHPLRDVLLELPDLPRLSEEIRVVLRIEKARRQAFRDALRPDQKAEFINGVVIYHSPASLQHLLVRKHIAQLLSIYRRGCRRIPPCYERAHCLTQN